MLLFEILFQEIDEKLPTFIYYVFILILGLIGLIILVSNMIDETNDLKFKIELDDLDDEIKNNQIKDFLNNTSKEKKIIEQKHNNNIITSFGFYAGLSLLFGIIFLAKESFFHDEKATVYQSQYFETEEQLTEKNKGYPTLLDKLLTKKEILAMCETYFLDKKNNSLDIQETYECLNINYLNFEEYIKNFERDPNFTLPSINKQYNDFIVKQLKKRFGDEQVLYSSLDKEKIYLRRQEKYGEIYINSVFNKNLQNIIPLHSHDFEPKVFKIKWKPKTQ